MENGLKAVLDAEKTDEKIEGVQRYIKANNGGIIWAGMTLALLAVLVTRLLTGEMRADYVAVAVVLGALPLWLVMTLVSISYRTKKLATAKKLKQQHADEVMEIGRRYQAQMADLKEAHAKELAEMQHAFIAAEARWIEMTTQLNMGRAYDGPAFGGKQPPVIEETATAIRTLKTRLHIPAARIPLANSRIFQQ